MMIQKVIPECLFVSVADERRRRRRVENCKLGPAHPPHTPPQGHSCNHNLGMYRWPYAYNVAGVSIISFLSFPFNKTDI